MPRDSTDPSQLSTAQVEERCRSEIEGFLRKRLSDERFCLEVFRRALRATVVEGRAIYADQEAWAALLRCQDPFLRRFLARQTAFFALGLIEIDDLVQIVWERFSQYGHTLTLEHLPQVLKYLEQIAVREMIAARRRKRPALPPQSLHVLEDLGIEPIAAAADSPEARAEQRQLDAVFMQIITDPLDREIFLLLRFSVKPQEICELFRKRGLTVGGREPTARRISDRIDRMFKQLAADPRVRGLLGADDDDVARDG
jgi:DNA-directed RNA polymerase specialized sigma24 family protein